MNIKTLVLFISFTFISFTFLSVEAQQLNSTEKENLLLKQQPNQITSDQVKQNEYDKIAQKIPPSIEIPYQTIPTNSPDNIISRQSNNQQTFNNMEKSLSLKVNSESTTLQQIAETNSETLKYVTIVIATVSLIIGASTIASAVLQWNANRENRKILETRIDDAKLFLNNEVISNIEKIANERLPFLIYNMINKNINEKIQSITNSYENHLRNITTEITSSAEQNFYLAQLVRCELWSKRVSEEILNSLDTSATTDQLLNIIAHQEADALALAQLLSLNNQQIFTGLGTLSGLLDPLPSSLLRRFPKILIPCKRAESGYPIWATWDAVPTEPPPLAWPLWKGRYLFHRPCESTPQPGEHPSKSCSLPTPAWSEHRPVSRRSSAFPKSPSNAPPDCICCGMAGSTGAGWACRCDRRIPRFG